MVRRKQTKSKQCDLKYRKNIKNLKQIDMPKTKKRGGQKAHSKRVKKRNELIK